MKYGFIKLLTLLLILIPFESTVIATNKKINNLDSELIQKDYYLLGPGDVVYITFIGAQELSSDFMILSDGNIQLPLVGTQSITGLTLTEAKNKLISLFSEELIRPEININLVEMRPLKVSIVGEVYRPGIYSLNISENTRVEGANQSNTLIGYPTVVDAIQKAGGVTLDSNIKKIVLYRKLSGDSSDFKKVKLDLFDVILTGNQKNNPNLFDGDIIRIPKLEIIEDGIEDVPNNLMPDKIKVYVIGEVKNPGMHQVSVNTTINKAILIAGGPLSWRYQKNNIKLLRVKRNGKVDIKKLKFNNNKLISKNESPSLRDGDIIQVNKNLFGKSSDALGTFLPPIRDIYSLYGVYSLIED